MQVNRQVIEERPDIDLPRLITESVSGTTLKDNLTSYFKEQDVPNFLNIMKENNIYIAGGFVLKNILQNQPGYKSESWSKTDIDFWAVSSSDTHQDPYCPLRKFLKSQGYESRILCSKGRINQLPADYKRLKNFIEQIEEWYQIDYQNNNEKKNFLQLMLLKDYNSHVNNVKKEMFFQCNQQFNQERLESTLVRKGINKFETREDSHFIIDAILTFDLTCCQCSFNVTENNPEGIITFYGTTLDYPEQTPIINNVLRYLTKISANIFRTQGILEWSRTLKRSAKYASRGFTIVNWKQIVEHIIDEYGFIRDVWDRSIQIFLRSWNRFIFANRFFLFSLNIPIFYITTDDESTRQDGRYKLNTFTIRDRRVREYGLTRLNPTDPELDPLANFRVTKRVTYEMMKALTGNVGYMNPSDLKYYEAKIPLKLNQLPRMPYQYMNEEKINLNEKKIIEEEKTECFDPILFSNENNITYIQEDKDNILLIFREEEKERTLSVECWNRSDLITVGEDPTNIRYKCKNINEFTGRPLPEDLLSVYGYVDTSMEYIKISSSNVYVTKDDFEKLMNTRNKIFYLVEPHEKIERIVSKNVYDNEIRSRRGGHVQSGYLVSADHCQNGTQMLLYKIKVCGGPDCLELIFGDDSDNSYPKNWLSAENSEYNEYPEEVNEDDEEPYPERKEQEEKRQESDDEEDESDDEDGGPPGGFSLQRSGPIRPPPIMIPPRSSAPSSSESVPSTPRVDDVSRRLDFDELDSDQEASDEEEGNIGTIGDHLTDSLLNQYIDMITPIMYDFEEALRETDLDVDINNFESDGIRWASLALNNQNLTENDILSIFDWLKSHGFIFSYQDTVNGPLKKAIDRNFLNVIEWLFEEARISRSRQAINEAIDYTREVHSNNPEIMDQIIDKLHEIYRGRSVDVSDVEESDLEEGSDQENYDQEEIHEADDTQILFNKLQTETSQNEIKTLIDNLTEDEIERIQMDYPDKSILYYLLQNPVVKGDVNLFEDILDKLTEKRYFYYIKEIVEAKPTLEFLRLIGQQNTSTLFYDIDDLESILEDARERNEDGSYDHIIHYFENLNR
jgi:hypothetical protein